MVSKITTPITPLEQTEKINEIIDNLGIGGFNILEHKWSDHIINDISWLRADTFSWQSGAVYVAAYNHLVADISGKTATSETVGSYTISYYLADDGHKITTDESTVANIYNESGVAWYYVLDTVNTRFKLPRTKYGFVGLRDAVGKYVPESLPNITGGGVLTSISNKSGATQDISKQTSNGLEGGSYWNQGVGAGPFNASRSSSTYQDSAPVQQRATQMYLYFYVGNYEHSAVEQTAGLNSELFNGKIDRDMSNMNPSQTAKETIVGWGMPDWSSGVSKSFETIYQAEKDGYILFWGCFMNGQNSLEFWVGDSENTLTQLGYLNSGDTSWVSNYFLLPIAKGKYYQGHKGPSSKTMTFYPCLGE